jgi:hypothetical protein
LLSGGKLGEIFGYFWENKELQNMNVETIAQTFLLEKDVVSNMLFFKYVE